MARRLPLLALVLVFGTAGCSAFEQIVEKQEKTAPPPKQQEIDFLRRQVVSAQEQSARREVEFKQLSLKLKTLATEMRQIQNRQNRLDERVANIQRGLLARKPSPRKRFGKRVRPRPRRRTRLRPVKTLPPPSGKLSPERLYNRAYQSIRKKKIQEAILRLREFLRLFPNNRLAGNAQYWLGESYYDLQEYPAALEEFEKVLKRYPKSRKVPAAIYKRAFTYLRLKEPRNAALEFEKLMDTFPKHPLTRKARAQIRSLNLAGNSRR